jgi:hypothetical protein
LEDIGDREQNRQVGEKWVYDDCSYLCKGLYYYETLSYHPQTAMHAQK